MASTMKKAEQQRDVPRQHGAGPREQVGKLRRPEAAAVRAGSRKAVIKAAKRRLQVAAQALRGPVEHANERAELVRSHETAVRAGAVVPLASVDPLRARDRQPAMCVRLGRDLEAATALAPPVSERRNRVVMKDAAAGSKDTTTAVAFFLASSRLRLPVRSEKCSHEPSSPNKYPRFPQSTSGFSCMNSFIKLTRKLIKQTRYACEHLSC